VIKEAIATLGIPGSIAVVLLIIFAVLQLIGEFVTAYGKAAPAFMTIRRVLSARKKRAEEQDKTLKDVGKLLEHVHKHYNEDNIAKRDEWMGWVNSRAEVYDRTIIDYKELIDKLTDALNKNTKMTEQMFVESSRDRIIDFASKISNPVCFVSREEFHRIFKIYQKYEDFLESHGMTNGEIEVNYQLIQENYRERTVNHTFLEDVRSSQSTSIH
jgi:hypothetical protein